MKEPIYLDYNATSPVKPAVIEHVSKLMAETGNASSVHQYGRSALMHIEKARQSVADLCHTHPNYVTFTSGATESNNTVLSAFKDSPIHVCAAEHPSIINSAHELHKIPVDANGLLTAENLESYLSALQTPPALFSIMMVNNETGIIQPIAELARIIRRLYPQSYIHCDAVQAAGRIEIDFSALNVDYLSLSAHKFGGPQGVGALLKAPGAKDIQFITGGGQEKRQRAGTENVAGIAGMGIAAELALQDIQSLQFLEKLRDDMETALGNIAPELVIFGHKAPRVGNTSCLCLPGIAAETQLMNMDLAGIAVSNGSACSSGKVMPSHVLQAMGANENEVSSAIRLSMGWQTTQNDIDKFIDAWTKMYERVKNKIKMA